MTRGLEDCNTKNYFVLLDIGGVLFSLFPGPFSLYPFPRNTVKRVQNYDLDEVGERRGGGWIGLEWVESAFWGTGILALVNGLWIKD